MIINIQDDILKLNNIGLLDKLLIDKTTKKNIMWATDAYSFMKPEYERNEEIKVSLITGHNSDVIKTRARKQMEHQAERTRTRAEVFTPLWVVKKMNDYADETWFERGEIFFKGDEPTEVVTFPEDKKWQDYVDSRRLEITCGEAPFLVSRYDVETGEMIPIDRRIGILDRKLRVVNENARTETEWLKWAVRAFQATYGYEFQGDNLLIARVNMVMTFEEYMSNKWGKLPTKKEYEKIVNIITWNLWQMDGLTGTIPYSKTEDEIQISFFDILEGEKENTEKAQPPCRIYDWLGKNGSLEYISLRKKR